jgi:hypothetical protein
MGYYLKPGRVSRGMALGGTSCGAGQTYRGNVTFNGVQGQCMTDAQYATCKSTGKYAGMPCQVGTDYSSIASGLLSIFAPAPSSGLPAGALVAPSGMSTTTKLALAAGAVALVAVIATRR